MKAEQAKAIWRQVVDDLMGEGLGSISMASVVIKLKRVKFTYGGQMKQTCKHSSCSKLGGFCEHWYYAVNKFPSFVKEWEKRKQECT